MTAISTNYRELSPAEIPQVAAECEKAWQDPEIPMRQYQACVKGELEAYRSVSLAAPFGALVSCMANVPTMGASLLDVGASSGYYREILRGINRGCPGIAYTGFDYSPSFKDLAERLYPGIRYDVGDARALPYADASFDIVLSGACIMHIAEYAQVIREMARVSNRYVILHRTPFVTQGPTRAYEKEAYGVRCIEFHFAESELFTICHRAGLELIHTEDIFWSTAEAYGHRTYLFRKVEE